MIVAGTGHRPNKLGGYGNDIIEKYAAVADKFLREIKPKAAISGMALGWDQALAIAAVRLDIPLVAAIPFKGQESMWPQASQKIFNRLLKKAEKIIYVCEPGYAAWKMQRRNEWMVDKADVLLACWDGSSGGTKNCIDYADRKCITIINVWGK